MKRSLLVLAALLIAGLCLVACSSHDPLAGTSWQLTAYRKTFPLADTTITAIFEDGRVSGSSGYNSYRGEYKVKKSKLTLGTLQWTVMLCTEPEGVMEQENDYIEMLLAAERYELRDGELLIYFTEHDALTFEPLD